VVADRFDRRRLLVGLDLFRALVMVALAFVAWSDGPPVLAIALAVVCTAATMFLFGFEEVIQVVVADDLGMGANGVGVLAAAVGVGGLLVAPFTARLGGGGGGGRLLALSGVLLGLPMMSLAVIDSAVVACAVLVVEGIGVILAEVLFITLLQRTCPERTLGTVYGLQDSITAGTQMAGSIAAPLLVSGVGLSWSLVVGGGVVVASSVLLAPALDRLAVRVDADRRRLAPMVQRLRRLGIFGEASHAALERIARATTPVAIPAGTIVCRQGDIPDDLYVIDSGEVAVSTAAQGEVNRLRADDWFGEIGLLRRVPRTATVTTTVDSELLRIPGSVFIDALAGSDVLPDPLRSTMTIRLVQIRHPLVEAGPS
jgi:hypothetical protein